MDFLLSEYFLPKLLHLSPVENTSQLLHLFYFHVFCMRTGSELVRNVCYWDVLIMSALSLLHELNLILLIVQCLLHITFYGHSAHI